MYPFERFAEDAKKALTLAQEEAERARHSYIGTEHLLLGLLRLPSGKAPEVLNELGIDIKVVRQTIAAVLGRSERTIIQQIIPTSRVKMVIEIAFEEARRMGHESVDTGHLLMALVMEGEGIAAHVLEDLGAPAEKVVAALERKWGVEPSGRGKRAQRMLPLRFPMRMRLREMRTVAGFRPTPPPESDAETLQRLIAVPHIAALLGERGLNVDELKKRLLDPPDSVRRLRSELAASRSDLGLAAHASDYELAARLQKKIAKLSSQLRSAEEAWLKTLGH